MSELPRTRKDRLEYFEAHYGLWVINAAAIGVVPAQATALKNSTAACRTAFDAMNLAHDAAKSATQSFYNTGNAMADMGRTLIATVKAFAETSHNPNVYVLANIAPPAPPTPVPAPATPTEMVGSVSPDGVVTLTWKATPSGPSSGVFFLVERKRMAEAAYTPLGGTAEKAFLDPAPHITAGPVQYRLRAVRGGEFSDWTQPIIFNFGAGGGGVGGGGLSEVAGFVGGSEAGPLAQAA